MLDIIKMLKNKGLDDETFDENWVSKAISEDQEEVFLILRENYLQLAYKEGESSFFDKYYIAEEFTLGRPFINSEFHFTLIHGRKVNSEKLIVGLFNGATYDSETMVGRFGRYVCPPEYNWNFLRYIKIIEEWINKNVPLVDDKNWIYEFNEVDSQPYMPPREHSKKGKLVKKFFDNNAIDKLRDVAEIYSPHLAWDDEGNIDNEKVWIVEMDEQKPYLLNNATISHGYKTNIKIQVGDIIFPQLAVDSKPFLVTAQFLRDSNLYAATTVFVIRPTRILPEYLWLYLISDVAICVNETYNIGKSVRLLYDRELNDYPIIKPNLPDEDYKNISNILNNPNERYYSIQQVTSYEKIINGRLESINDVLALELINTVYINNNNQLYNMLRSDMQELNICYNNGAYKAVLILAGSILEAVLIDWLSEIHRTNYFEHEYRYNGKKAVLKDYIESINVIKSPNWMNEAQEADEIRQNRNLVHAKLCLNSTVGINADTCNMVISYLKDVLASRNVNIQS